MRIKSFFGVKSITNLIYGLLMIAPFVAILSRVIYVQSNPNAKDSYSDVKRITNVSITQNSQLQNGFTYVINDTSVNQNTPIFFCDNANDICLSYGLPDTYTYVGFRLGKLGNNYAVLGYDTTEITSITNFTAENHSGNILYILNELPISFKLNSSFQTNTNVSTITIYQQNIVNNPLDSAFEYSLQEFTKDNDIGVINFFGWFDGYFLNQTNSHNLIYLNFANWYMNYALLVSSGYLLFLCLIWFVNYVRRILDKSMNQEYGGF